MEALDFNDDGPESVGVIDYCDQCGAEHWLTWANEYTCDVCGTYQTVRSDY